MYELIPSGGYHPPAIREPMFPAVIEPVIIKRPWYKRQFNIQAVDVGDFYEYQENVMVVYRVVPHAKVGGNNRRMWTTIHRMYEMYNKTSTRVERKGFKFTHREKDTLWYDIIFRNEGGRKKIEFYISTTEFQSEKLKRMIENTMQVTLEAARVKDIEVPVEDTNIHELRYAKHDIFSLNTKVGERQTPITSILHTVDELQYDGDFARYSVCNEVEDRRKWVKNASWAREKALSGKVPQRANLSAKNVVPHVKTGITAVINEVYSVIMDTMDAFSNVFFKDKHEYKKGEILGVAHTLEDEIKSTRTTKVSGDKINMPVFKSSIRIAAHSKDRLTRDTIGETLSMSLNDMSEDNEVVEYKIKKTKGVIQEMNSLKVYSTTKYKVDKNLVSTDEMNKIAMQMPTREIQARYADEMSTKKQVESVIPDALQRKENLLLGYARMKDREYPVGLNTSEKDEFYCGYTFIGKQGVGKDTLIQNTVHEGAMKHGISYIVMDWICEKGNRGMADGIRNLLPKDKIIDLDLSNEEWIIPMDLTEVVSKLGRKGGSRFALEMVDFLDMGDLPRSQKFLMEASKASGGSLRNIKRIIEDEDYRMDKIEELIDEGNIRTAKELSSWGPNEVLGNKCDAILSRLNMFFGDDTLHDIFSQKPLPELNFEKWMSEGKTIIVRMPKRVLGNASAVLAHWVTLKVFMTRMLMSNEDKEKHGCFVIFNEPEQVVSKGMAGLMGRIATEGRKERLGSMFAFHHWDKLPGYLQDNLLAGGVNQMLFASEHKKTFENAKERLLPEFTMEDALGTPKFHAIAILNTKVPIPAILVKLTPPVPTEQRYDNSELTIEHAKLYGRSWEDLQKE